MANEYRQLGTPRYQVQQQVGGLSGQAPQDLGAQAFLRGFAGLSQSISSVQQVANKQNIEKALAEGEAWRKQSKKSFRDAVRDGDIHPTQNPHFAVGALEYDGKLSAENLIRDARNEWAAITADPDDARSTDPEGFSTYWQGKVDNFAKENGNESQFWANSFYNRTGQYFEEVNIIETEASRERLLRNQRLTHARAFGSLIDQVVAGDITGVEAGIKVQELFEEANDGGYQNAEHSQVVIDQLRSFLLNPSTSAATEELINGVMLGSGPWAEGDAVRNVMGPLRDRIMAAQKEDVAKTSGSYLAATEGLRDMAGLVGSSFLTPQAQRGAAAVLLAQVEDAWRQFPEPEARIATARKEYDRVLKAIDEAEVERTRYENAHRGVIGLAENWDLATGSLTAQQVKQLDRDTFQHVQSLSGEDRASFVAAYQAKHQRAIAPLVTDVSEKLSGMVDLTTENFTEKIAASPEITEAIDLYLALREEGALDKFTEGTKDRRGFRLMDAALTQRRAGQPIEAAIGQVLANSSTVASLNSGQALTKEYSDELRTLISEALPNLDPSLRSLVLSASSALEGMQAGSAHTNGERMEIASAFLDTVDGTSDGDLMLTPLPLPAALAGKDSEVLDSFRDSLMDGVSSDRKAWVLDTLSTQDLADVTRAMGYGDKTEFTSSQNQLAAFFGIGAQQFASQINPAVGIEVSVLRKLLTEKDPDHPALSKLGKFVIDLPDMTRKDVALSAQKAADKTIVPMKEAWHLVFGEKTAPWNVTETITLETLYKREPDAMFLAASKLGTPPTDVNLGGFENIRLVHAQDGQMHVYGVKEGETDSRWVQTLPKESVAKFIGEYDKEEVSKKLRASLGSVHYRAFVYQAFGYSHAEALTKARQPFGLPEALLGKPTDSSSETLGSTLQKVPAEFASFIASPKMWTLSNVMERGPKLFRWLEDQAVSAAANVTQLVVENRPERR